MNKVSNTPQISRIEKFRDSFNAFKFRHGIDRPHPIKKWKALEPRVKNLFGAAALAVPGFVTAVTGVAGYAISHDDVKDCRNTPPITEDGILLCKVAEQQRSDATDRIFLGGIAFAAVGLGATVNDTRLIRRSEIVGNPPQRTPISR